MVEQVKNQIIQLLKGQKMYDTAQQIEKNVGSKKVLESFEKALLETSSEYHDILIKHDIDKNSEKHKLFSSALLRSIIKINPERQLIYDILISDAETGGCNCNAMSKISKMTEYEAAFKGEKSSDLCFGGKSCQSFIDQHNTNLIFFSQQCNGEEVVIFEDFTNNHSKSTINAITNNTLPCVATIIFETMDGNRITRELRPGGQNVFIVNRLFFVEDLRRVLIRCDGDPAGVCSGRIRINKTFCIACCRPAHKSVKSDNCFVDTHITSATVLSPCDGTPTEVYENFTPNHNKTAVSLRFITPECQLSLILVTKGETITRSFADPIDTILQVEDLQSISVECTGDAADICLASIVIRNSFCICCKHH
ncbi:MAG: hypothetical protein ACOZCL_14985 [Bacillota bacterium]